MIPALTDRQIDLLSHALGADKFYKCHGFYRNYFAAGGDAVPEWEKLVELGFAFCSARAKFPVFHVNQKGQDFIRGWLRDKKHNAPKISRSKKRYMLWLALDIDERYGEFIKDPYYKQYRKENGC